MDINLFKSPKALFFRKIKTKAEITGDCDGFLIDSDEKEVRKITEILKAKEIKKNIAVVARDDEFNRRVIETCRIDYLVSPEFNPGKDGLKQRSSGLNHVVAKIASEKNVAIVVNFTVFNKLEKKEKAQKIARIIQNVKICRKANCKIKIATFASSTEELRDKHDLMAFAFSLGMSSEQVASTFEF